jgi:hypothetical protein
VAEDKVAVKSMSFGVCRAVEERPTVGRAKRDRGAAYEIRCLYRFSSRQTVLRPSGVVIGLVNSNPTMGSL